MKQKRSEGRRGQGKSRVWFGKQPVSFSTSISQFSVVRSFRSLARSVKARWKILIKVPFVTPPLNHPTHHQLHSAAALQSSKLDGSTGSNCRRSPGRYRHLLPGPDCSFLRYSSRRVICSISSPYLKLLGEGKR